MPGVIEANQICQFGYQLIGTNFLELQFISRHTINLMSNLLKEQ